MADRDVAMLAGDGERLDLFDRVSPGRRVAGVADSGGTFQLIEDFFGKYVSDQPL